MSHGAYVTAAFQTPVAATYKTIVELKATANTRLAFEEASMGVGDEAPADNALTFDFIRTTAAVGAGTSITPALTDPADVAALATALEDLTTEPTTSGISLFEWGVNQRGTFRWVANPGSEVMVAAVANAGLAFRVKSPAFILEAQGNLTHRE